MPKIVDKEQKRKDIALSCKELFLQKGINQLTISEVAKTAGIGKGTVYEYFENKEDIIFEIVNILSSKHDKLKKDLLKGVDTTREKVKVFSNFFYNEEEQDLRMLLKEFVSISLMNPNEVMIKYQSSRHLEYYNWFKSIMQEGIDKGELKPNSMGIARGLFTVGLGMFITYNITNTIDDLKKELEEYIDSLFEFIEVKNDK